MSGLSLHETSLDPAVIVHTDEPVPGESGQRRHAWVTCKCGEKRLAYIPTDKKKRTTWTGLCPKCSEVNRRKGEEVEKHSSGTLVYRLKRHPADSNQIEILCHGCGLPKYAHVNSIKHHKWSGLCGDCIEQRGSHLKFTHDEHLRDGTVIHWGEPDPTDPDKCMVTCPRCGDKRSMTRAGASALKQEINSGGGGRDCRNCHGAKLRAYFSGQQPAADSEQPAGASNGAEKERFDRQRFKIALDAAIDELLGKGIPLHKITRKAVTKNSPLGGEYISPDALTKRMRFCGIELSFSDYVESRHRLNP